jgi:hypothetical protein
MPRYHEIYAFQGSSWDMVQGLDAERPEVDRVVEELWRRPAVLGVRVLAEEDTRRGDTRMRMLVRKDKREGLPTFALGPDGRPVFGGRPVGLVRSPALDGAGRRPPAAGARGRSAARGRPDGPRLATGGEWLAGAGLVFLGGAALVALDRVEPPTEAWATALDAARLGVLLALIGVLGLFLARVVRSGLLHVEVPGRRAARAAMGAGGAAEAAARRREPPPDPNEEALVRRGAGLVEEGFRRVRDRLDAFGWLGFRLFLAGLARGMAPAGPADRQRRYLRRLLDRIGDGPAQAEDFVARWDLMGQPPRNREMIEHGARAWESMDPQAFARAMEWWTSPADEAPVNSAVVCVVPVQASAAMRRRLSSLVDDAARVGGGQRTGDDQVMVCTFPGAFGALDAAAGLLQDAPELRPQLGVAVAVDPYVAVAEARSLAGRARGGEALVSAAARDLAEGRARFGEADAAGGAPLLTA